MTFGSCKELWRLLDECVFRVEYLEQELYGISDLILVHILASAMDLVTRMAWEATRKKNELPTYTLHTYRIVLPDKVPVVGKLLNGFSDNQHRALSATKFKERSFCIRVEEFVNSAKGQYRNYQLVPCPWTSGSIECKLLAFASLCKGHSVKDCSSTKSCKKRQKRSC